VRWESNLQRFMRCVTPAVGESSGDAPATTRASPMLSMHLQSEGEGETASDHASSDDRSRSPAFGHDAAAAAASPRDDGAATRGEALRSLAPAAAAPRPPPPPGSPSDPWVLVPLLPGAPAQWQGAAVPTLPAPLCASGPFPPQQHHARPPCAPPPPVLQPVEGGCCAGRKCAVHLSPPHACAALPMLSAQCASRAESLAALPRAPRAPCGHALDLGCAAARHATLGDLWRWFEAPSLFGAGVPMTGLDGTASTAYFVPSLSALQLLAQRGVREGSRSASEISSASAGSAATFHDAVDSAVAAHLRAARALCGACEDAASEASYVTARECCDERPPVRSSRAMGQSRDAGLVANLFCDAPHWERPPLALHVAALAEGAASAALPQRRKHRMMKTPLRTRKHGKFARNHKNGKVSSKRQDLKLSLRY